MIFCENCKHKNFKSYGFVCFEGCTLPKNLIQEHDHNSAWETYGTCSVINANNDCLDFEAKKTILSFIKKVLEKSGCIGK